MTKREICEEVKANFRAWYERNFLNCRHGRVGGVSYVRAGALDDSKAGASRRDRAIWYASAYERSYYDYREGLRLDEARFLVSNPLVAFQLLLGVTDLRGLRCYRRGLTAQINRLQQRSYRARYYARDNERRRRLAVERRKITRRTTLNPCPTPAEFLAAFERRGESVEAKVRFGGMVHDLECYVDNCLKYDGNGEICGRNGGIKAWIAVNLPQLNGRYKTIMRYKALAKRLRQAAGIEDPVPTSAVYDGVPTVGRRTQGRADERPVRREVGNGYYAVSSHNRVRTGRLEEIRRRMDACRNVLEDLFRTVDAEEEAGAINAEVEAGAGRRKRTRPARDDGQWEHA